MHSLKLPTLTLALLLGALSLAATATAQTPQLQLRADKGGYLVGESATVTVTGLTECADKTVALGMRDVGRGARFATKDVQLDSTGSGSVKVALMSEITVSPAAWGTCVDRGLEPGLALDPHITLISVSYATEDDILAFIPAGARDIARTIAAGDLEGIIRAVSTGEVIQTGYPGDGGPLPRDQVIATLRTRLAPGSGTDDFGTGQLGLLGAWEINGGYALLASVIRSGDRHVQALGVKDINGTWVITSSGAVVMSTGILQTYAEQHELRLAKINPLPPSVGNSPTPTQTDNLALALAALALTLATTTTLTRRR